jgi:hypothetical protein
MKLNSSMAFTYPYSKLLGARPCGKDPTPQPWVRIGADPNIPVYKNAPRESCGDIGKSCTPQLRFKDGDNDLVVSRKELRQANNRALDRKLKNNLPYVTPVTVSIFTNPKIGEMPGGGLGAQTPFRALMNAGDPASSVNKYAANLKTWQKNGLDPDPIYANPSNQVSSTTRSSNAAAVTMSGYMPRDTPSKLTAPGGGGQAAMWSGNPRWVYDGTDYVRFKKLQAKNRNFNDVSWGGDRNNASQVALSRVRR